MVQAILGKGHAATSVVTVEGDKVQSDWEEYNPLSPKYIENKPELHRVATTGSYDDLNNRPSIPQASRKTIVTVWPGLWDEEGDFFVREIEIPYPGINSFDNIVADIHFEEDESFGTTQEQLEAWSKVVKIETATNKIKVFISEKMEASKFNIQLLIVY